MAYGCERSIASTSAAYIGTQEYCREVVVCAVGGLNSSCVQNHDAYVALLHGHPAGCQYSRPA